MSKKGTGNSVKMASFGKRKMGKAKKHKNKREDGKKYRGQGR